MKAQVLVDFMVEMSDLQKEVIEQQVANKREWKLYVDRAVEANRAGACIILQGPK